MPLGEIAAESIGSYLQVRPLPRDAESDDILFLSRLGRAMSRVSIIQGDIPAYFQAFFRDSSYREWG